MEIDKERKKVVYKDGDYTKVLIGRCFFEDNLVKVETDKGDVWVGKASIISIKGCDY